MFANIHKGAVYIFFSALLSALNGAVAKILGDDLSALEIVFFRNLFGVVLILLALKHTPSSHPGGQLKLLIYRGVFGFSAMLLFFYTITTIPLAEAVTLNKTSPLFVAILAFLILGEKPNFKSLFSLFIGFFGVVLITKPFGMEVGLPHLLGLIGGFLAAAAYTTIGKIKEIYDSRVIVLSFMGTGVLIPLLLFFIAEFYAPKKLDFLLSPFILPTSPKTWILLVIMAITATLSQWLLTKAYSSGKTTIVGVVSYIIIPFSLLFGLLLGDKFPDLPTMIGILLIIIAGLMVRKG